MKSIVLLSAGLDSAVNLAIAIKKTKVQYSLTFDYGQRAAKKEVFYSHKLSSYFRVDHLVIKLPFYQTMKDLKLISGKIPSISEEQLKNQKAAQRASLQVWVPNRNLVFVAIAAALAEYFKVDLLVTGFNLEESQTFPDNSADFLEALNCLLTYSTKNKVRVSSFTLNMNKREIVEEGIKHKIPWELVWSCYQGSKLMCGKCESCARLLRAARETPAWEVLQARFENA